MVTRRAPETGLTADTAAMSPQHLAAFELQRLQESQEIEPDQTPAERILSLMQDFSNAERASVKLYRVIGPNKYTWLNDYSCEDFEAQGFGGIRSEWGAGEFQVRLYATLPNDPLYCVRAKENITIEAGKTITAPAAQQQNSELASVLNLLVQGQQKLFEVMAQKPAADPMAEMTKMLGMMSAMREAMGLNHAQSAPQKSNITEIMETIRELRAVSDEINPKPQESPDPDNPMSMLPQLLEIVKMGMNKQAPQQQQNYPAVSHQQTQPVQPVQQPEENDDMRLALIFEMKKQLAVLLEKANAKADVQETAKFVYEELPDEIIDAFFDDSWWEALSMLAPEVAPHKEWFTQVRDAASPMFDEQLSETPASPT